MHSIVFYTTHCPACNFLREQLDKKNISYIVETDEDVMLDLNITTVPVLEVNGELLKYKEALQWVNTQ